MRAVTSVTVMGAVNQPRLSCCASKVIKSYDDVGVLSKVCIAVCSCIYQKEDVQAKLVAATLVLYSVIT